MIIYKNDLLGFQNDVDSNMIADLVESSFLSKIGRRIALNEKRAITNSMQFMESIVRKADLSETCGVQLEYMIPTTSKRIDFMIAGKDGQGNKNFVIVELKQWDKKIEATRKDGIVKTPYHYEDPHPSYQAYAYKSFLMDFHEDIYNGRLKPFSCAYLHNYRRNHPEPLEYVTYEKLVKDTPIYFKDDYEKLQKFLNKHVRYGSGEEILYEIEKGKIRPSKKLIDYVTGMFEGNSEFTLLDKQKLAYETALDIAKNSKQATAVIIKGGPGTGKSVISVNLLGALLKEKLNPLFVAPNAAFREVIIDKLAQNHSKTRLRNIFSGSSSFTDMEKNAYDVIIVDEAHRLKNQKAFMYQGENQVKDILNAGRTAIFFIDDDQVIRPEDIGSVAELKKRAKEYGMNVREMELSVQFRCSGAEGYVNWLNNTLHIKDTANYDGWESEDFEFKIFEDPNKLREAILEKDRQNFNSRILAGYAWSWTSHKKGNPDADVDDIVILEHDFSMPWNSRKVGSTWAIDEEGVHQAGCIHTSQGLEFDYVGVIVGNDLCFDPDKMEFYADWKSYKDSAGKSGLKEKPEELKALIKNIYKVLMSRAHMGCYVYFVDKEAEKYFKTRLNIETETAETIDLFDNPNGRAYIDMLPFYTLEAACGAFGESVSAEPSGWIKIHTGKTLSRDMFVTRVKGNSMEPLIYDGDYCMFRKYGGGSRSGKIVLVQSSDIEDPETGGQYTVKKYTSEKEIPNDETWRHTRILLKPLNPEFEPIVFDKREIEDFKIIAEFIAKI